MKEAVGMNLLDEAVGIKSSMEAVVNLLKDD
jgi:hypothetical protein